MAALLSLSPGTLYTSGLFSRVMQFFNLQELEALASKQLTKNAFDYYASGANDELTLHKNHTAFERIELANRVLVDVNRRDASTTVLGYPVSFPVILAPTAFHKMACPEGEVAAVRAASDARSLMILSSLSNTDVEEVVEAARCPVFFQLYIYKDRQVTEALVHRVEKAGCKAIVVTVDAPFFGKREKDVRNRFALPEGLYVKNLLPAGYGNVDKQSAESGLTTYSEALFDQSFSWKDIAWLRSITTLPIVIKGIIRVDDALRARDHGASAIVVSNHGGRQLDTAPASIDALPPIAQALQGSLEIWMDGGVRRGTDIIKALALGAKTVCIGRPILWGLALEGSAGAAAVLEFLRREFDLAMALTGCPDVGSITPDLIFSPK